METLTRDEQIGAGTGALAAKFTGLQGKDSINTVFSVDKTNHLIWKNPRFTEAIGNTADFVVAPGEQVYAHFGGFHTQDTIPAKLLVKFL
jgi:hypothetical protein